jgi:hypothetical protein
MKTEKWDTAAAVVDLDGSAAISPNATSEELGQNVITGKDFDSQEGVCIPCCYLGYNQL